MPIEGVVEAAITNPKTLEAIASGVVTKAAAALGKRVYLGARTLRNRERARDVRAAETLDSYSLALEAGGALAALADGLSADVEASIRTFMESVEVEGLVHELLAASLLNVEASRFNKLDQLFHEQLARSCGFHSSDGQITEAATALFEYLCERCEQISESVATQDKDTISRIQHHAAYNLIADTLASVDRHLALFTGATHSIADEAQYEAAYRRQLDIHHGTITPPDFDRRHDVPIEDLYVSPRVVRTNDRLLGEGQVKGWTLVELWSQVDRTVLLGEPGGGKSTATQVLIHKLAVNYEKRFIPYLVVLRDYGQYRETLSIVEYIEQRLRVHYQASPPPDFVERSLLTGRAVVFFDGLDELLDTSARREITDLVQLFSSAYPLAKIFVTSRLVGYERAPMSRAMFEDYYLANFSDGKVGDYVERWFKLDERLTHEQAANLTGSFLKESLGVRDLRRNPLMLALMCIIYRGQGFIPRNRPAVYERCATLLFETWDSSRQIKAAIAAEAYLDEALKHLALWMLIEDRFADGVTRSELVDEMTNYLNSQAYEDLTKSRRAAAEFVDFCKDRAWVFSDAGTTAEGIELYKFTHRTFMEYFAAYELTRQAESPEALARKLLPHVARDEWDMVGQLAVQIENKQVRSGSERALMAMLSDRRRRTDLHRSSVIAFIIRCCSFANLSPAALRTIADEAFNRAFAPAPRMVGHRLRTASLLMTAVEDGQAQYIVDQFQKVAKSNLQSAEQNNNLVAVGIFLELMPPAFRGTDAGAAQESWPSVFKALLAEHAELFDRAFTQRPGYRLVAVYCGLLEFSRYVQLELARDGARPLDPIFHTAEFEGFRSWHAPIAYQVLQRRDMSEPSQDKALQLILDVVSSGEAPPWVSTRKDDWVFAGDFMHRAMDVLVNDLETPLSDDQFCSLLAGCIFLELSTRVDVSGVGSPLAQMTNYVFRARGNDADAQALVEDSTLPELLKNWALNRVDFVA